MKRCCCSHLPKNVVFLFMQYCPRVSLCQRKCSALIWYYLSIGDLLRKILHVVFFFSPALLVIALYTLWYVHLYLRILILTIIYTCDNGILNYYRCSTNKSRCGSQAGPERTRWCGTTSAQPYYPFFLLNWSPLDCKYETVSWRWLYILLNCTVWLQWSHTLRNCVVCMLANVFLWNEC